MTRGHLLDDKGRVLYAGPMPCDAVVTLFMGRHPDVSQAVATAVAYGTRSSGQPCILAWRIGMPIPEGARLGVYASRPPFVHMRGIGGQGACVHADHLQALCVAAPEAERPPTLWTVEPRAHHLLLGEVVDASRSELEIKCDFGVQTPSGFEPYTLHRHPRRGCLARVGERIAVLVDEGAYPHLVVRLADLSCWPGGEEP